MLQDALYILRSLRRQPGFFAVAICTLTLGIASTTAVFSLFYQILLRTLPVPAPRELVVFHADNHDLPGGASSDNAETVFSYPMYRRLRDSAPHWQGIASRSSLTAQLSASGTAERAQVEVVSGNFFETLRMKAFAGRLLSTSDDAVRGASPVVVLSHGLFMRRFGAKNDVIGAKITLNGQPFDVIGVAPERFHGVLGGDSPDVYIPISMRHALNQDRDIDRPSSRWLTILGRLPENTTPQAAQAAIRPLFSSIVADHVQELKVTNPNARKRLESSQLVLNPAASGLNELKRQWEEPLVVLLGMVGLLLLIACANLANLLLARGVNRAREIAVRVSLGATRGQILQLLLSETIVITVLGAALGAALAPALVDLLVRGISEDGGSGWVTAELSWPVLLFSTALACVSTLLAGLAPAWQISRPAAGNLSGRSPASAHARSRKFFVSAQVALSLVLLAVAGLFGKSLSNLMRSDPGFRAEQLSSFVTHPGLAGYDGPRGVQFAHAVEQRLAGLPGVSAVSFAEWGPLQNATASTNIQLEGYQAGEEERMDANVMSVGPGYFATLGTPLTGGRGIEAQDTAAAPRVAVVNQAFVKRFLKPGESVLGRHMSIGGGKTPLDIEIIGVAADTKHGSIREAVSPTFFVAYEQQMKTAKKARRTTFYVRSATPVPAATLRGIVAQLDGQLPVFDMRTMEETVNLALRTDRLISGLSAAFGGLALLITAIGLYGVLSYLTQRRTTEFGIRMALGSSRGGILRLVFREVLLLVGSGTAVGLLASLAAGHVIASQLFGVCQADPLVLVGAPALLAAVAAAAASLPSWRAAAVQPLEALRHE